MRKVSKKTWILMVSILLVLSVTVGSTIAFLSTKSGPVENTFNASKVTTFVNETFDGTTKSDVTVSNTGDTDAWIRAAIVITWQDAQGNVYGGAPVKGTDYSITMGNGWILGNDGYYYWPSPVAAGKATEELIDSCTAKNTAPEGYALNVEILGSGIQSKPAAAFNAWAEHSGVKIQNPENPDPALWTLSK